MLQVYPHCCKWQDILSRGWIIFHCSRHSSSFHLLVGPVAGSSSWLLWIVLQQTWECSCLSVEDCASFNGRIIFPCLTLCFLILSSIFGTCWTLHFAYCDLLFSVSGSHPSSEIAFQDPCQIWSPLSCRSAHQWINSASSNPHRSWNQDCWEKYQ